MTPAPDQNQPSLIGLLEEAMHLLRRCEVTGWAWWLAGTCPFTVGAIYFVNDMSRSAEAGLRLPAGALWLAISYWWMMICHAVFADGLLRTLRDEPTAPALPFRGKLRFLASQAFIPATGPWVLALASLAMLPFGWVYAAYQNFNVLALSLFRTGARTRDLLREAIRQSRYRPGQNHGLLSLLPALGMLVWANLFALIYNAAALARYFTGDENPISRNPLLMVSSGIIATTLLATYVLIGPLHKALYALRCFASLSLRNGDDLALAFKRAATAAVRLSLILWIFTLSVTSATAQTASVANPPRSADAAIPPAELQESIQRTLQRSAYQWRLPREVLQEPEKRGWLHTLVSDIGALLRAIKEKVADFLERLLTAKVKEFFKKIWSGMNLKNDAPNPSTPWADVVQRLLKWLLVALGITVSALLLAYWRRLPANAPALPPGGTTRRVDLEDAEVLATQMPEAEWLNLAAAKQSQGDNRQAMRALFLASLAHLGERQLVRVERSKSNGDYVRELAWRARTHEGLRSCFAQNVQAFERAWYGTHEVESEHLEEYRATHQRILSHGLPS